VILYFSRFVTIHSFSRQRDRRTTDRQTTSRQCSYNVRLKRCWLMLDLWFINFRSNVQYTPPGPKNVFFSRWTQKRVFLRVREGEGRLAFHTFLAPVHLTISLQRGRIACSAERCNSYGNSVCPSNADTLSRRMKIESCGLHHEVPKTF